MNSISNLNGSVSNLFINNEQYAEKLAQEVIQKRNQYPSMQAFIPEKQNCETYLNFFKRAVKDLVKGEQMLFGNPSRPRLPKHLKKKPEALDEIYRQFTRTFNRFQPYLEGFNEDFPVAERNNIQYARENIFSGPLFFLLADQKVREDEMMLSSFLSLYGYDYLQFASEKYKDDPSKIWFCLNTRGVAKALKYASPRLKSDKQFILKILNEAQANWVIFKYVSEELRGDPDIASLAIQKSEIPNLQYSSDQLKDNKLFVMEALKYHLESYKYASKRLQEDDEVILLVIEQYSKKIDESFREYQRSSSWHPYESNPNRLSYEDAKKQLIDFISLHPNKKSAILAAMKHNYHAFNRASEALQNDRDFVLEAVSIFGGVYEFLHQNFKDDKEILLKAVQEGRYPHAIKFANETFRDSEELFEEVYKNRRCGNVVQHMSPRIQNNKELLEQLHQKYDV